MKAGKLIAMLEHAAGNLLKRLDDATVVLLTAEGEPRELDVGFNKKTDVIYIREKPAD